jgi:hypothetical protein
LATTHGPMFLISSPYAKRGELWEAYSRHFGPKGDKRILVAQAASREMNPNLSEEFVARQLERDPIANASEYLAVFRRDIEGFLARDAVEACVQTGVFERLPERVHRYVLAVDPSGGASDSMTACIAHKAADTVVVDAIREFAPPFNVEAVCLEISDLAKKYRVIKAHGDRYGGDWPKQEFRKHGLIYDNLEKTKSECYVDFAPQILAGAVDLLDHKKLVNQLCGLERSTARSGKDSIDHSPGAHDDVANAVAASCVLAMRKTIHDDYRPSTPQVEGVSHFNPLRY